jgi:hypothetical protein
MTDFLWVNLAVHNPAQICEGQGAGGIGTDARKSIRAAQAWKRSTNPPSCHRMQVRPRAGASAAARRKRAASQVFSSTCCQPVAAHCLALRADPCKVPGCKMLTQW